MNDMLGLEFSSNSSPQGKASPSASKRSVDVRPDTTIPEVDDEDGSGSGSGEEEEEENALDAHIVKPLTTEALAEFEAAQARTGVVYISRIPPAMRPSKVRHLMSAYGEIGRIYLQQEGERPYQLFVPDTSAYILHSIFHLRPKAGTFAT